jgi:hypothetical protein
MADHGVNVFKVLIVVTFWLSNADSKGRKAPGIYLDQSDQMRL